MRKSNFSKDTPRESTIEVNIELTLSSDEDSQALDTLEDQAERWINEGGHVLP